MAAEVKGYAVDLSALDKELTDADIVVSCTASSAPLITKNAAAAAVRARRHRPIFMVDLAVPRDIDPAVAELEDIYLFSIDDLQQLVDENRQQRELAAGGARLLLEEEVARFLAESRAHDAGPAIRALRQPGRYHPLHRPWSRPGACWPPANRRDEVIEYLANTLTNRLLHSPTQALRQASESADSALADTLARLLIEERGRQ